MSATAATVKDGAKPSAAPASATKKSAGSSAAEATSPRLGRLNFRLFLLHLCAVDGDESANAAAMQVCLVLVQI